MKNSTLLRLFFISIGLPLTCASSSSSTSSTPTPSTLTTKSNTTSLLVDSTNTAPDVPLEGTVTGAPSVSGEISVSGIEDTLSKELKAFIDSGNYEEVIKLVDGMDKGKLLKHLCQVVTTLDHFKGLFGYLKQHEMVPDFLAHGRMALVKEVIVETELLETHSFFGWCASIYDAIALSFKEDRHKRVADLFEAARERPRWENKVKSFVGGFFDSYHPEKDSLPLKRFLTLYGEEFSKKHSIILEAIYEEVVLQLKWQLGNSTPRKLLVDLVGQPSLLTPVAFAKGFLCIADNSNIEANFIKYGWRETIEEGLKEEYPYGGRRLWAAMGRKYPESQFSGEYPSTGKARAVALENFKPTKQSLEEAWAEEHAPILLKHLETLATEFPIAKVLLPIIAGYAITWVVVQDVIAPSS